jgi:hypothetical protein
MAMCESAPRPHCARNLPHSRGHAKIPALFQSAIVRAAGFVMPSSTFIPSIPAKSEDDFEVSASTRMRGYRRFFGQLRVTRKTDGRQLFPFDGAPDIGPYTTQQEALAAAQVMGERIVQGDLDHPEM